MTSFLPNASQLAAAAALLLLACLFTAIGAFVGGRGRQDEADLPVGWAVVAILFTVAWTLSSLAFRRVAV